MKKIIASTFLFFLTFIIFSLLALPILLDLIFSIFIFFIFRKNYISIIIFNLSIVMMIFIIDISFGKNEKYGYFYRAHEKYTTKKKNYQKNISDIIFMPHGDIYVADAGLDKKREQIKVPREQQFITDSYGIRNDKTNIEDAEIILVGDSFITGNSITQKHIPSNVLSEISGKKVASLSYGGLDARDYEIFIDKYLNIIRKDAKIFVFYFEGNDFVKINNKLNIKKIDDSKYFEWRGHQIPLISGKIRFAYERLERNKDKFLLRILSEKNYFLRNVRAKSHLMYRKFFSKLHNTGSPVQYFEIGNKTVGFLHTDNFEMNNEYTTYIFKNNKILERVTGLFFIPTKLRIYSPYINSIAYNSNNKLEYLINSYSSLGVPVYDLSKNMSLSVAKYLSEGKYLYWRDDTHWNHNGIFVAMNYVSNIIKK
mgnify:FL=1